jgi:two-component system nitrate/nitrite response regulator NarL
MYQLDARPYLTNQASSLGGELIRVFVVAGVRVYREGLEFYLAGTPSISVTGSAAAADQARRLVPPLRPDVLLLDLGVDTTLSFTREVRAAIPDTKVIGLADARTTVDVVACVESGMLGYLTADTPLPELVTAIRRADRGEATVPPHATARLFDRLVTRAAGGEPRAEPDHRLTARELEILRLIDRGLTNKQIARTLSISVSTVKNHVHHVLRKLRVERRSEATALLRCE